MSRESVGAYLRVLREAKNLSRQKLAQKLQVDDSQVERVEKGETDTRGSFLMLLVHTLGGNICHVMDLMLREDATVQEACYVAEKWLQGNDTTNIPAAIERLAQSLDLLRQQQWIGYGERLLEEQREE